MSRPSSSWGILSPLFALALFAMGACGGGERAGTKAEGDECNRTAECRTPLICCPDGRCSRDLGCLEGGVIPYQDGGTDADTDTDTDTGTGT